MELRMRLSTRGCCGSSGTRVVRLAPIAAGDSGKISILQGLVRALPRPACVAPSIELRNQTA